MGAMAQETGAMAQETRLATRFFRLRSSKIATHSPMSASNTPRVSVHQGERCMLTDRVAKVLSEKGNQVYSVTPEQPAIDAMVLMVEKGIAAVLVISAGRPVGIVSAKDYGKRVVLDGTSSERMRVGSIMTSPVITVNPEATVSQAMALMTSKRIRHLPVMDQDRLVGIVTVGDLARSIIQEQALTIDQLHGYIGQKYPG